MKIGIFDKWIKSLGGGEKVATVMAETLSKKYDVDLISYVEADKDTLEKKMGVNLEKVKLVSWLDRKVETLSKKTAKYDLFINISFLDHLPSLAKKSIYYILFPTPIKRNILGFIKYETVLPFLRRFLLIPEIEKGLDRIDEVAMNRAGFWLHNRNRVFFSNAPRKFIITLRVYIEIFKPQLLDHIKISSQNSKLRIINRNFNLKNNVVCYNLEISSTGSETATIDVNLTKEGVASGMAIVSLTVRNFRYFLWNMVKRYLPGYEMALYGSSNFKPAAGLFTYNLLLADSKFSQFWTKKYWGEESTVLYPPIDVDRFKPGKKKNMILNVGRFFVGGHAKKQDILIKAFKDMVDKKILDSTWQLHFVGGVASGETNMSYVKSIKKDAEGYPILFHFSAGFGELKKLFSEAKIYWHATGFGESKHEPIKFEHFGMTVVEAMAAGCVPIVFRHGGVAETVSEDIGFSWESLPELKKETLMVAENIELFEKLSKNSVKAAKLFSRKRFSTQLLAIVETLTK